MLQIWVHILRWKRYLSLNQIALHVILSKESNGNKLNISQDEQSIFNGWRSCCKIYLNGWFWTKLNNLKHQTSILECIISPALNYFDENWKFMSGCVLVLESAWMVQLQNQLSVVKRKNLWLILLVYTHHHTVYYCGIGVAVKWIVSENFTNNFTGAEERIFFRARKHWTWTKMNNWWGNPLYSLFSFSTDYESARTKLNPF